MKKDMEMGTMTEEYSDLESEQMEIMLMIENRLDVIGKALFERFRDIEEELRSIEKGEQATTRSKFQNIPKIIYTEYLREGLTMNPQDDVFVIGTKKTIKKELVSCEG